MSTTQTGPLPVPALRDVEAYRASGNPEPGVPSQGRRRLKLDGNEGRAPDDQLLRSITGGGELCARYAKTTGLELFLAERLGLDPSRLLVTAGADDGLLRSCLAFLDESRNIVLSRPTFEMLPRYARLTGATLQEVPWSSGAFPIAASLQACTEQTGIVAVVSPNNPTGLVAQPQDLEQLSRALPSALLLVDLAYEEFADEPLTECALQLPNAVVLRTLSKAQGLAGLRVGYVAGPAAVIDCLRAAGNPYPVAGPSLALARARLAQQGDAVTSFIERVRVERGELYELLNACGARALPSQANFVFALVQDPAAWRAACDKRGVAIRAFPGIAGLEQALRISCPGNPEDFELLSEVLRAVALEVQA